MDAKDAYQRTSALLDDYLEPLSMLHRRGPLRAMADLVRGILWSGSVQLTNACRVFAQTSEDLGYEVDRLSTQLANPKWDHREWMAAVLGYLADRVEADDLIAIDGTDLAKPYARNMQWQCIVQDASRRDKPLVPGYWCFGAYAWKDPSQQLHSLLLRPWSQDSPDFISENALIDRWFWSLHQALGDKGIWLMDRGFDRPEILASLLRFRKRWIVRLRSDRPLIGPDGLRKPAHVLAKEALAAGTPRGHAVTVKVRLPTEQVRQAPHAPTLWLVIPTYATGEDEHRLLLTCGLIDQHAGRRQVRHHYALRWRAEDARRMFGQLWHIEKFLTRSFLSLERMLACVALASRFIVEMQQQLPDVCDEIAGQLLRLLVDDDPIIPAYRVVRGLPVLIARAKGVYAMTLNA